MIWFREKGKWVPETGTLFNNILARLKIKKLNSLYIYYFS